MPSRDHAILSGQLPGLDPVVFGVNEGPVCTRGWYERERDPRNGVTYRWTWPRAAFEIPISGDVRTLRMMVAGAFGAVKQPLAFSVYCGSALLQHFDDLLNSDLWTIAEVALPEFPARHSESVSFNLICERRTSAGTFEPYSYVPHRHLQNGDYRQLGIMVAAIRVV